MESTQSQFPLIKKFFTANPKASNKELYAAFPNIPQSTLRTHKAKYQSELRTKGSAAKGKAAVKGKKAAVSEAKGTSLTARVFHYLKKHPNANNEELYRAFPDAPKTSIRVHKSSFFKNMDAPPAKPKAADKKKKAKKEAKAAKLPKVTAKKAAKVAKPPKAAPVKKAAKVAPAKAAAPKAATSPKMEARLASLEAEVKRLRSSKRKESDLLDEAKSAFLKLFNTLKK